MSKTFKQFIAENTSAELTRITDSLVVKKVRGGKYKVVKADEGGRFQMGEPLSSNELPYPDEDEHGLTVPHVQVRENHPKRGHTTFMYNVDRNPVKPPPITESKKDFVAYINGKVLQSTHRDFVVGQDIVPSDLERPNIHFEDRSKRGSGPGSKLSMTEAKKPHIWVGKVSKPGEPLLYRVRTSELESHPEGTELTDKDLKDLDSKANIETQNTNRNRRFQLGLGGWFKESEGGSDNPYGQMTPQLPRVVLMKHNDGSGYHTVTNHDTMPAHVGERAREIVKYNSIISPDDYSILAQLHQAKKIELSPAPHLAPEKNAYFGRKSFGT